MSNARTFGSPATSPVKCPLCNGTGSEGGGVGGRVIRCRGCNGEKMVSPEKAYQIENGFNLSRMSAPGTSPGAVHSPGGIKSEPVEMALGNPTFRVGERVRSEHWGSGIVERVTDVYPEPSYRVRFDDGKTISDLTERYLNKMSATPTAHALARAIHEARKVGK